VHLLYLEKSVIVGDEMKDLLLKVISDLDLAIEAENRARMTEERTLLPKAGLKIVGQCSLFLHPNKLLAQLSLFGTADLDALLAADYWIQQQLREILQEANLEFDQDSAKIWLPEESTFTEIFSSRRLVCQVVDPIYALVSKAIKAKEKNRQLIHDALILFGADLRKIIEKHRGDCAYFE